MSDDLYISILTCSRHKFFAIAIEDEEENGTRITPSKCCGSWTTVRRWKIDESMREDIFKELLPGYNDAPFPKTTQQKGNTP